MKKIILWILSLLSLICAYTEIYILIYGPKPDDIPLSVAFLIISCIVFVVCIISLKIKNKYPYLIFLGLLLIFSLVDINKHKPTTYILLIASIVAILWVLFGNKIKSFIRKKDVVEETTNNIDTSTFEKIEIINTDNLQSDFDINKYWTPDQTIKNYEHNLVNYASILNDNTISVDEKIRYSKETIKYYDKFRNYCYNDYHRKKYFEKMWMHCHNSKNPDFNYIDPVKEQLQYCLDNYDKLKQHEKLLQYLDINLMSFLKDNQNILQKDIYQYFDESLIEDIRSLLWKWEKDNIIVREKKGNTYIVNLNK